MNQRTSALLSDWLRFLTLGITVIWLTHTIVYFAHEYAHSATAWLLGCKSNPLDLEYGRLDFANVLLLHQVDENVQYSSIFAQGRGHAAGFIAFAGMGIGNLFLYLLARLLLVRQSVRRRKTLFLCVFWFCFMNVGNFYDYVPVRTFASHGDIAHITRSLNLSPWLLLVVFGYPTAWALWHCFARALPDALPLLAPGNRWQQAVITVACVVMMFGYFGASGFSGYGEVSRTLSGMSMLAVPGIAAACWPSRHAFTALPPV